MANTKSAKKQARKNIKRREINLTRKTSLKSTAKKLLAAIEQGTSTEKVREILRDVEAKFARAKNKGTIHAKTAARKISRLAKRVATSERKVAAK